MKYLNFLFVILCFVSSPIASLGQTAPTQIQSADTWQKLTETSGVIFYYQRQDCAVIEGQKPLHYSFLKIVNTTVETKKIEFNFGLQYKEGCSGCESYTENFIELTLPANTEVIGDCSFEKTFLSRLITNPNLSGGWVFEKEIITNLSVEK